MQNIERRTVIKGAALLGLSIVGGTVLGAPPGAAVPHSPSVLDADRPAVPVSLNGWSIEDESNRISTVWTRPVPGTGLFLDVRVGVVETVLVHLVRRYHYEIDELREGDLSGWRGPRNLRLELPESNLASGTAIRIRPEHYPAGLRGGYFPSEQAVVRDILAELDGVVRWGADDKVPDESIFMIDTLPGDVELQRVSDRVRSGYDIASRGAGTAVDVTEPGRLRAARLLKSKQRSISST